MAYPHRGEIWLADLRPTRGREQTGCRPVLILSVDFYNAGLGFGRRLATDLNPARHTLTRKGQQG